MKKHMLAGTFENFKALHQGVLYHRIQFPPEESRDLKARHRSSALSFGFNTSVDSSTGFSAASSLKNR